MSKISMTLSSGLSLKAQQINGFGSSLDLQTVKQLNATISPSTITLKFASDFNLDIDASLFNSWSGGLATLCRLSITFMLPNGEEELATINPVEFRNGTIENPNPVMQLLAQPLLLSTSSTPPANFSIPSNNSVQVALKTISKPKGSGNLSFEYSVSGALILPKANTGGLMVPFSFDPRMIITD